METKSKKPMTASSFLAKCTANKAITGALGFLTAHREFLLSSEVAESTAPIIQQFDDGELTASNAVIEIGMAVANHIAAKAASNPARTKSGMKEATPTAEKPFRARVVDVRTDCTVQVFNESKGEMELLDKCFTMPQEAQRWVDRRLANGSSDWYAVISHNEKMWEVVERDHSIGRVYGRRPGQPGQICKTSAKSSGLGWGVKARQSTAHFSHG